MVCTRCKMVVRSELEKLGLHCSLIELGMAETIETVSDQQITKIKIAFIDSGLELISDKKNILVEKIKHAVIEMVHYSNDQLKINFSNYLAEKLNHDYTYLANTFSEEQGITIEHFIISHKIQKVKELIGDDELNLTEISWKLHYSSVAHLSAQFKKVTGVTPSHFKQLRQRDQLVPENV